MNTQDVFDRLKHPKRGLPALLQEVSGKGAKTIKEALELLDYLELLQGSVDDLWYELADNSATRAKSLARFPDDKHGSDLLAAFLAVDAVIDFLRFSPNQSLSTADRHKRLKILGELRQALLDLVEGGAPTMLRPQLKDRGRRADVSSVLGLKGVLAGLMHCQQRAGMSRHQAAKWIADNMSPKLASRISRKPITARMVEEWLDRFGGKHADQNAARGAYLAWSQSWESLPLTKAKFKAMTERIAEGGL
jgi:hypothetical protein